MRGCHPLAGAAQKATFGHRGAHPDQARDLALEDPWCRLLLRLLPAIHYEEGLPRRTHPCVKLGNMPSLVDHVIAFADNDGTGVPPSAFSKAARAP